MSTLLVTVDLKGVQGSEKVHIPGLGEFTNGETKEVDSTLFEAFFAPNDTDESFQGIVLPEGVTIKAKGTSASSVPKKAAAKTETEGGK